MYFMDGPLAKNNITNIFAVSQLSVLFSKHAAYLHSVKQKIKKIALAFLNLFLILIIL